MAKPTLTEYKESKGYLDYLKSTNTDKKAFDTLPENEQLQILEKYFRENGKRVKRAKKVVSPYSEENIDALISKAILSGDEKNPVESLRTIKELHSLKAKMQTIKDVENEIERKKAQLDELRANLAETLKKYHKQLG